MRRILLLFLAAALLSACAIADQRGEMLVSVAVGELGYSATPGGYTKYGEWGGKAYGEYCSEFVSWCVNRADELYASMQLRGFAGEFWYAEIKRAEMKDLLFAILLPAVFLLLRNYNVAEYLGRMLSGGAL